MVSLLLTTIIMFQIMLTQIDDFVMLLFVQKSFTTATIYIEVYCIKGEEYMEYGRTTVKTEIIVINNVLGVSKLEIVLIQHAQCTKTT